MRQPRNAEIERFQSKYQTLQGDGCWEWCGGKVRNGYGTFYFDHRKVYAHRFSYELHVGPIGSGQQVDHLCRNRACVRPDHLEAVSARENLGRSENPAMRAHVTDTCFRGHSLSDAYTGTSRRGEKVYVTRKCRTCQRERDTARPRRVRPSSGGRKRVA